MNKGLGADRGRQTPCLDLARFAKQSAAPMTGVGKDKPKVSLAAAGREDRQARLAEALRENLKKRKDQARARAARIETSDEQGNEQGKAP